MSLHYFKSTILNAPYNRQKGKFFFALYRFFIWGMIKIFRLKHYVFSIWGNRKVILSYDSVQSMWLIHNYWVDWEEYNLIKKIIKKNDTVFDIGANIGLYSLWMSRFASSGSVHSFEPNTDNFNAFKRNIELNKLSGRIVINKEGIADHSGILFLTNTADVQNHLTNEKTRDTEEITVTTLDDYCANKAISRIKYLKIDIEGFEFAAFKGAEKLLSEKSIDIIQLEINNALSNSGVPADQLIKYLNSFGYSLASYNVKANLLKPIPYDPVRENYFAVINIESLNKQLQVNAN